MRVWLAEWRSGSPDTTLLLQVYSLLVGLAFGLGVVILSGGSIRFSGPSFDGPVALVGWLPFFGAHVWWGLLFLSLGLTLVTSLGHRRAIHVLRFGLVVFLFLSISLLTSVFVNPAAALTGIIAYTVLGLLHAVLAEHVGRLGWR